MVHDIKVMIQEVLEKIDFKKKELQGTQNMIKRLPYRHVNAPKLEYVSNIEKKIILINEELDDLEETLECLYDDYREYKESKF